VLRSRGVSGDGGLPRRLGVREGNRRARIETPIAMAACVAVGLEERRGLVAERTASSRRPRGVCLAPQGARSTFVPRTCARRQARAAWGQPPLAWPLCGETPGRTKAEAPRRWPGPSVMRQVEGEERANRGVHVAAEKASI